MDLITSFRLFIPLHHLAALLRFLLLLVSSRAMAEAAAIAVVLSVSVNREFWRAESDTITWCIKQHLIFAPELIVFVKRL